MARLSKNNKYAILWLNSQGNTTESISKELNIPIKQIDKVLIENDPKPIEVNKQAIPSKPKDFMIRHSQNNVNSVAIMTQQASMLNDEARKNYQTLPNNSSYIHKIS